MNIFNVRKGQFVYYNNQLHQVYSIKPFFKQSVHLIRLKDFKQQLSTAKAITLYKPQHLDSYTFNQSVYTLDKDRMAEIGDHVLVVYPSPDYLDHHYLHAIEMVASIETNGIISTKENGIKHREYWVMVSGVLDGAENIDLQDKNVTAEEDTISHKEIWSETKNPRVGDIFEHIKREPSFIGMVIAIQDETVYLGGGYKVKTDELADQEKWIFKNHVSEELT